MIANSEVAVKVAVKTTLMRTIIPTGVAGSTQGAKRRTAMILIKT